MNKLLKEKILPTLPLIGLFLHFTFNSLIQNSVLRTIWIVFIVLLLSSEFIYEFLVHKKRNKTVLISALLALGAFGFYQIRELLDIPATPGVSPDAMKLPAIRDFLLLLVFILAIASFVYIVLLQLGRSSEKAQTDLVQKKQNLILNSILNLMILIAIIVLINYISIQKNYNFDLSAKGKYSLSGPSRTLLKNLDKEVEIAAFYPRPLEASGPDRSLALTMIRPDVEIILDQIRAANPNIKITFINADVETDLLTDYGQVSNGSIIVRSLKKTITAKDEPYAKQMVSIREKSDLETMERKLVQAILNVSAGEKNIYFTVANGERYSVIFNNLQNEKISKIEDALRFLNYKVSSLGLETGWPGKIPEDADAIAIIGPTVPFNESARNTILNYIMEKKGSVLITIDPRGLENFDWLLQKAGLKFNPLILSQFQDKPGIIVAKNFREHAITDSISGKATGVVISTSGFFAPFEGKDLSWTYRPILESGYEVFSDMNLNGKMDGKENKVNGLLGIQVEEKNLKSGNNKKEKNFHLLIYSSTAWLTNQFIFYNANPQLAVASFTWLNQDTVISEIPEKKEEVKQVALTEDQKLMVWVIGLFLFPGFVFGVGAFYIMKRRKIS